MPGFLEGEGGGGFQGADASPGRAEQLARISQEFHSSDLAERPCDWCRIFLVNDR